MPPLHTVDRADATQIETHLRACEGRFVAALEARVDLRAYASKLAVRAARFEAWDGGTLVGLVAAYLDPGSRVAFVSHVGTLPAWKGRGLASALLERCIEQVRRAGMAAVRLEVASDNLSALGLYHNAGFRTVGTADSKLTMELQIDKDVQMENGNRRDYDGEARDNAGRRYAYGFDFDVMHPYMIRSFEPFFRQGNLLELGSFKGDFTRRFVPLFRDITCVEASREALEEARGRLGEAVAFVHARFEDVALPRRYDNIVLTHVLEHLDDPVAVLRRVNDEWLADGGRLFLVCPNANAPSRQIAVKMGLITHNAAVTPAEAAHGHRCTYSLDTLERDAARAGLHVVHRSGIFFKALANFQWDRLLQTDIVSPEYLEGCYKLGQQYPDLCSSIFLLCERGRAA